MSPGRLAILSPFHHPHPSSLCHRTLNLESRYLGSSSHQLHTCFLTLRQSLSFPESLIFLSTKWESWGKKTWFGFLF